MLEDVKIKQIDRLASEISSSSDVTSLFPSKGAAETSSTRREMVKSSAKGEPSYSRVDPAMEVQEDGEGSDPMEDAVSDVSSTCPSFGSVASPSDSESASKGDGAGDEPNGSANRKRVHFADDADNASSMSRSLSSESLSIKESNSAQRSNLRKRVSPNVNPRPSYLTRKTRETFHGDHVSITPADSLEFVVMDFQKDTLDIINLKNTTEEVVTYKVKTTAPEKYRVRPSNGVIKPGESVDVNVYLPPGMHSTNRDKFLIMSLVLPPSISEGANDVNDLWKSASKEDVVEHRIRCVLVDHSQSQLPDAEALSRDLTELKEASEKTLAALAATQRQIRATEEVSRWNQTYLKILFVLLLALLALCLFLVLTLRRMGASSADGGLFCRGLSDGDAEKHLEM